MIVVLKPGTAKEHAEALMSRIRDNGCRPLYLPGTERVVLGAIGDERLLAALHLEADPQVESVKRVLSPHQLVSRELHPHDTIVEIGKVRIGAERFVVIAGPPAVENRQQLLAAAEAVKARGAACLRAGVFFSRQTPYSFQGLGVEGARLLADVASEVALPGVADVLALADLEQIAQRAEALLIDEANMRNYRLLEAVGRIDRPVFLERGRAGDLRELLLAAEYVASKGNDQIVLCERGIRTFEQAMPATLDLSAIPYLKQQTHLPVVVDVSRSTGRRELMAPMAKAAAACGADGLMIQVHADPAQAQIGGQQSLYPEQFAELMHVLRPFVEAAGRTL